MIPHGVFDLKESVQVIDVSVANKICNGKFYLDNKKLKISISSYFVHTVWLCILDGWSLIFVTSPKQLEPFTKEETTVFYWLALTLR